MGRRSEEKERRIVHYCELARYGGGSLEEIKSRRCTDVVPCYPSCFMLYATHICDAR